MRAGRSDANPRDGLDALRVSPLLRWLGTMSTRTAVLVLVAATLIGVVFTLIAGSEPGFLLGIFITVGSVAAALGIRRGAVYLMFPLPAFAFFVAAFITGKVHDSSLTSSTTGLGVGGLQWIADIFFPTVIATIAVLVVGGARWVLAHQLVIGQFPTSAGRAGAPEGARPAPAPRRPAISEPWDGQAPADDRAPRPGLNRPGPDRPGPVRPDDRPGPAPRLGPDIPRPDTPRPDAARPDRMPRDQRTDRDPWGDPRQPPVDPPRSRANARDDYNGRPATPGRGPGSEPRDRAPRLPGRPPWEDRPRSQSPRDPWDNR
jgi:hypothetical protein